MGMPTQPVLDIMHRTMENLAFIEKHSKIKGPYEVTQLVNSFLGALAHPWETMRDNLNNLSLHDAQQNGWPKIDKERGSNSPPQTLPELIRLIRNSVAHGNIEYLSDGKGQIAALRIWNNDPRRPNLGVTWGAVLTVATMRRFLECFVLLIEERDRDVGWYTPRVA